MSVGCLKVPGGCLDDKSKCNNFDQQVSSLPYASEWIGQNVPRFGMSGMCLGGVWWLPGVCLSESGYWVGV